MRRLAFLLVFLAPSLATAQTSNVAARAQSLFEQAVAEARAGNYAAACPKFAASQQLDPKTSTLLNLASCYELNGQTASAWASFKEAEASAKKHARRDWEERAAAAVTKLEPKLVRLTIHVPEAMRAMSLAVAVDGATLQKTEWDQAVPVDPGEHRIDWSAPDYRKSTRAIKVTTANVEFTLTDLERDAATPPAPSASAPPAASDPGREATPTGFWTSGRVVGVSVAGLGVASLVAGSVFGLSASAKYDEAEEACGGASGSPRTCVPERSQEALAAREDASERATVSTVLFVGGAVLVAGGIALTVFASPSSQRRVALVPWAGGLSAVGRW